MSSVRGNFKLQKVKNSNNSKNGKIDTFLKQSKESKEVRELFLRKEHVLQVIRDMLPYFTLPLSLLLANSLLSKSKP